MNSTSSSLFGMGMGAALGYAVGGPLSALVGGFLFSSIFGGASAAKEQRKEQEHLNKLQTEQNNALLEKRRADSAELYSAVSSATSQTAGAMGAIY